jgi:signal transduction histidine kinase
MSVVPASSRFVAASPLRERSVAAKIGVLMSLLAVCTALRWAADPLLPIPIPYTFYLLAIVAVTSLCGARWGYAAIAISLLLALYLWTPPKMSLRFAKLGDATDVAVWVAVSSFIVWILAALQHAIAAQRRLAAQLSDNSAVLAAKAAKLAASEAKLREYAVDLERLVSERTEKLAQTVGDLESFAYCVSHNLRSPLRAMQGFSHLALEEAGGQLNERSRQYLRRIDAAAQRMDELIRDLLLFNSSAEIDGPLAPTDVGGVIDEALQQHPEWLGRGAVIEVRRPLEAVQANRASLLVALSHLLSNAVKFVAPEAVARVIIWTERHGDKVRILVEDNGIGVPPEFVAHLFKPFYRGHAEGGYDGRGIGLAIARKATRRMSGDIGVANAQPHGSVFWLELPVARSA